MMTSKRHSIGTEGTTDNSESVWSAQAGAINGNFSLQGSVKLAKQIEKQVKANSLAEQKRGSKLVYIALCVFAIAFGFLTYWLIAMAQRSNFESEFESYSREASKVAENNAANTFGQLNALAMAITSIANSEATEGGDRFPNLTVPHFDLRAQEISDHTGVEMVAFVPFVPAADKTGYEQFAINNQYWIWQDYDNRGWSDSNHTSNFLQSIPDTIHPYQLPANFNESGRGFVDHDNFMEEILTNLSFVPQGMTAPIAQFGPAPINSSLTLVDFLSHPIFKKEIVASLEYDVPVISETVDLEYMLQHIYSTKEKGYDPSVLRSFTLDPVKQNFHEGARTVGFLVGIVPWETFFRNLLPDEVNGVVIKVASDCGRNITYVVNGGKEDWSAEGDFHDTKYEHMKQTYQFFFKTHPKGISRHCHYDFHVYPNDEFAASYTSSAPYLYASIVVGICALMGIVFYSFDKYMQKRQTTIMSSEARTESVVTALFPPHVSEKLLADSKKNHGKTAIPNIMSLTNAKVDPESKPLADLFPSATIMFADIAGFTQWSSQREPFLVFTLLENLYGSFDALASQHKVFKIETIGDCYVAVAGLPLRKPEHAVIMANFARSCLAEFTEVVERLRGTLGPGTETLGLRTGLHSGPVTAGVLRGERARFQLFGDSVNTTARVESLGAPGRIHMSEETAMELSRWGKDDWLIPREDKVQAKGKGMLKTYWLSIFADTTSTDLSGESDDDDDPEESFSDEPAVSPRSSVGMNTFLAGRPSVVVDNNDSLGAIMMADDSHCTATSYPNKVDGIIVANTGTEFEELVEV